jgi:hypothetical protein
MWEINAICIKGIHQNLTKQETIFYISQGGPSS